MIVEVKGDNRIDEPVVKAKKEAAEQLAIVNGMTYHIIKDSEASGISYPFLDSLS